MKRAIRRHHRARLKKVRRGYHGGNWSPTYIDTPCPCSCWACGNQRRAFRRYVPTMQERREEAQLSLRLPVIT